MITALAVALVLAFVLTLFDVADAIDKGNPDKLLYAVCSLLVEIAVLVVFLLHANRGTF